MDHLINPRVKNIEISGIRKFYNMVSHTEGLISLTIGQPDFPTPDHVKKAGILAIEDNFTSYTHNAGALELRKAACDFVKKKYGLNYIPDSEVIVTMGASEAIDIAFRTILTDEAEVLLPGPVYPGYEPVIRMMGAVPIHIDTRKHQFRFTLDVIKPYITKKTRCIVLPYPSNPTGVSLTESELKELADFLSDKEIFVLADEIYSELTYDRDHTSIAQYLKDKTILINGLSKSHSMTGWRIGFLFAPETITQHILKVHQYNVSCANSIAQKAAFEALTTGMNDANKMKIEYQKRRNYVYQRLQDMELEVVMPEGAFYFFVKIPDKIGLNSFDFALDLVKQVKVAVVPGSAFSEYGEGYFRLSFACSMDTLVEGLDRIEQYFQKNPR
ncbi:MULTISPECIES: aminotransferase A [Neobacillus]|uniref:Aminotransferase n=1 Tax=Neobacillus sedimentimangrovi TaxID=2699460 RepID=A0ABS8QLF1_9BACI|nr:aminotransferase A [Neobacillus sedimentimangrovi]AIM17516.1 aromatic amino acid aminotransferase [Bacillus sp. X1(2014)]MCD4840129.1 aminotransferase A [Neobacillus sedimentimangrovi]